MNKKKQHQLMNNMNNININWWTTWANKKKLTNNEQDKQKLMNKKIINNMKENTDKQHEQNKQHQLMTNMNKISNINQWTTWTKSTTSADEQHGEHVKPMRFATNISVVSTCFEFSSPFCLQIGVKLWQYWGHHNPANIHLDQLQNDKLIN